MTISIIINLIFYFNIAPKPPANQELNYMKKEDFGKVPAYLTQVKEEIRRENDMVRTSTERLLIT